MSSAEVLLSSGFRSPRSPLSALRFPLSTPLAAFTLIELLTAMAILVIIVMIGLRIFLQSSTVWNLSSTRARANMLGRAATDYVAQQYAVTTNFGGVTIGNLGGTTAIPTPETDPAGLTLSVKVLTTVTVPDKLRAGGAVQAWSGGPDKDANLTGPAAVDNINSWD